MKYTCTCCGKEHEDWPALAFSTPDAFEFLSEEEKKTIAEISTDFCVIRYEDQTDRYIRCTLSQKVIDHCQDLEYGLWVSLSEKSYEDYSANYDNENHETSYFAYISNHIRDYETTRSIPSTVFTRLGNSRPEIVPHEDFEHPFVTDYYHGITKADAEQRIERMLKTIKQQEVKEKSWWKFW